MPEIIEQPYTMYQDDPVISVTATGTAGTWVDLWKYQVPMGVSLIIKPEHTISMYLAVSTTECAMLAGEYDTCMVRIEKRDSSQSDVQVLCGPRIYKAFTVWDEKNRLAHFNVPPEGVIINEREFLVILVYDDGAITETDCYFEARIAKVRKALGA